MSVNFQVTISGDTETIAYFRRIANQIETHVTIPAMNDWAEAIRTAMIKRQHYRSGRMRSMTKITKVNKYWAVIVDVPYAEAENRRGGKKRGDKGGGQGTSHQYVEPSIKEVEPKQMQSFLSRLTAFINSH